MGLDLINGVDGSLAGESHTFRIPVGTIWTVYKASKLLQEAGILIRGRFTEGRGRDEKNGFVIPQKQAEFAEYLLCRAKVPFEAIPINPRNYTMFVGEKPSKPVGLGGRAQSVLGRCVDLLATITNHTETVDLEQTSRKKVKRKVVRKTSKRKKKMSLLSALDKLLD